MDFSGHFDSLMVDLLAGKQKAVLTLNEDARGAFDSLKDFPLSITIKKYRKKRSLNANAYFHVLVGKLADTLGTSKAYMKNTLLQKYGQLAIENDSIVPLIIRDDIDMMEREEIHVRPTDKTRIMDDGKGVPGVPPAARLPYLQYRGDVVPDTYSAVCVVSAV